MSIEELNHLPLIVIIPESVQSEMIDPNYEDVLLANEQVKKLWSKKSYAQRVNEVMNNPETAERLREMLDKANKAGGLDEK